jgi:hypothetical protein
MQRLLYSLLSTCVIVCLLGDPAGAQTERIFLIGGNYRLQGTYHNMQDGFFGAPAIGDEGELELFFSSTPVCASSSIFVPAVSF